MKKFLGFAKLALFCALAALSVGFAANATAADELVIKDAAVYYQGNKVVDASVVDTPVTYEGSGETLFWVAVDAAEIPGFKGAKTGIYFFKGEGEFDGDGVLQNANAECVASLPLENPEQTELIFSEDGKYFMVSAGTSPLRDLTLYEWDGLKKKRAFTGMGEVFWLPDDGRVAFTLVDEKKGERSPEMGMQVPGWMSVAVYDPAADILAEVEGAVATETADYMLDGINYETGKLSITENSVKDKADWAKDGASEQKQIEADFPAFG